MLHSNLPDEDRSMGGTALGSEPTDTHGEIGAHGFTSGCNAFKSLAETRCCLGHHAALLMGCQDKGARTIISRKSICSGRNGMA